MKMQMFRRYAARAGVVALCSAALCTVPMMAQGGGGGRGMMSPEQQQAQMDALTKAVGLTDDQVTQVKAINTESMSKMMALMQDQSVDPADRRPKMMAIRTDQQAKIKALLTDEQKPKYDAYLASQPRRGGGGAPGGAPAGGPPPAPPQ